jgi:hypothetical protein
MRTRVVLGVATLFLAPALPARAQCELQRIAGVAPSYFGSTFELHGDVLVVPAAVGDEGFLQLVRRDDGGTPDVPDDDTWNLAETVWPPAGARFSGNVALGDDVLVVDGPGLDEGEGEAFVYVRSGSAWSLSAHLTATPPGWHDGFGHGLAVEGDTLVVCAPSDSWCGQQYAGSVGVYARDRKGTRDPLDDEWVETQRICADPPRDWGWFGGEPALAGDLLAVAEPPPIFEAGGVVRLYARRANDPLDPLDDVWVEAGWVANPVYDDSDYGATLALSRDHLAVGAPGWDFGRGAVFVYARRERGVPGDLADDEWAYSATLTAPVPRPEGHYGHVVALAGERILVGWPWAPDAGVDSGAAHLYRRVTAGDPGDPADDRWVRTSVYRPAGSHPGGRFGWDVALDAASAFGSGSVAIHVLSAHCVPELAAFAPRNGSGINPAVYAGRTVPILGSTWRAAVRTTELPGATMTIVFARTDALPGTSTPYGELLAGGAELGRSVVVPGAGIALHALPVPADPALLGLVVPTQALVLGGAARLTNAVDLTLGY